MKNYSQVLHEVYNDLKNKPCKLPGFIMNFDELLYFNPGNCLAHVYIEPQNRAFFNPQIGPKKEVELFALILIITTIVKDRTLYFEICSYFNPTTFKSKKMEYNEVGKVVTTGIKKIISKELDLLDPDTPKKIKEEFNMWFKEALKYYSLDMPD